MIVLITASLVGAAVTLTAVSPYSISIGLISAPLGGSLLAVVVAALLPDRMHSPRATAGVRGSPDRQRSCYLSGC